LHGLFLNIAWLQPGIKFARNVNPSGEGYFSNPWGYQFLPRFSRFEV
jgi:hypothetical protein